MLKLDPNIQRFIISSPEKFRGEYEDDNVSIAIQFERNIVETFYRNQRFYMVSICIFQELPIMKSLFIQINHEWI